MSEPNPRPWLKILDRYDAKWGSGPDGRSLAYLALATARQDGVPGLPVDDDWPDWTRDELRAAVRACQNRIDRDPSPGNQTQLTLLSERGDPKPN